MTAIVLRRRPREVQRTVCSRHCLCLRFEKYVQSEQELVVSTSIMPRIHHSAGAELPFGIGLFQGCITRRANAHCCKIYGGHDDRRRETAGPSLVVTLVPLFHIRFPFTTRMDILEEAWVHSSGRRDHGGRAFVELVVGALRPVCLLRQFEVLVLMCNMQT